MQASMNPTEIKEEDRKKLLARIRKLFAMSKETESSPHEAETALRQCSSLMNRYGIKESELETSEFGSVQYQTIRNTIPTYLKYLAASVAHLNDCICVIKQGDLEFRGYEVDVTVCQLTVKYLDESLARYLRDAKKRGEVTGRSASYDFRLGFATAVRSRIIAMKQEIAAQQGTGKSLAIKKLDAVKSNCMNGVISRRSTNIETRHSSAASHAGREAGSQVSLNSQVSAGSHTPRLA